MNFYQVEDLETTEDVYINPKCINFYMYTCDGVLIDTGSYQFLISEADFKDMMTSEGAKEF